MYLQDLIVTNCIPIINQVTILRALQTHIYLMFTTIFKKRLLFCFSYADTELNNF